MKICFVTHLYPNSSFHGGIAVYTRVAAQALAQRGHEVHVLVPAIASDSLESMDGPVHLHFRPVKWVPFFGKILVGLGESVCAAWWLFRLHRQLRFDLVEFPNWEGIGLVSAWLRIAPIVVRLHTSTAASLEATNRSAMRGESFLIWAEETTLHLARSLVTHTQAHREKFRNATIAPVEVIPHGIAIPQSTRGERGLSVLVVGPLSSRKGAQTLLAAIPLVLARVPEASFLLAGPKETDPKAEAFRAKHPEISKEQVQFLGFVSNEDLAELYATCAVYASASIYESFGLTFIEAMACAKPVVGCAASAMVEVIDNERTGLLVAPSNPEAFAQAIVRLLLDPLLRTQLGRQGRQAAMEKYSDQRMAERIENYFLSVLQGRADLVTKE